MEIVRGFLGNSSRLSSKTAILHQYRTILNNTMSTKLIRKSPASLPFQTKMKPKRGKHDICQCESLACGRSGTAVARPTRKFTSMFHRTSPSFVDRTHEHLHIPIATRHHSTKQRHTYRQQCPSTRCKVTTTCAARTAPSHSSPAVTATDARQEAQMGHWTRRPARAREPTSRRHPSTARSLLLWEMEDVGRRVF